MSTTQHGLNGPAPLLVLGFKASAWSNGLGVVLVLGIGLNVFALDVSALWLRLPLALYLAGVLLSGVGLVWTGLAQGVRARQCGPGQVRRFHWIPSLLAVVCYALALLAFATGCWATLGIASLAQFH